jgi:hypothetical protein
MTLHQPFGKHRRLIDEIRFVGVGVPAWPFEGGHEAITMEQMMSRRRLSDLEGGLPGSAPDPQV